MDLFNSDGDEKRRCRCHVRNEINAPNSGLATGVLPGRHVQAQGLPRRAHLVRWAGPGCCWILKLSFMIAIKPASPHIFAVNHGDFVRESIIVMYDITRDPAVEGRGDLR